MDRADDPPRLRVSVAYSPQPRILDRVSLELAPGSDVQAALDASGLQQRHGGLDLAHAKVGVWGQLGTLDQPLRDGDRVEVYRPLQVDPKEARRLRHRGQRPRR